MHNEKHAGLRMNSRPNATWLSRQSALDVNRPLRRVASYRARLACLLVHVLFAVLVGCPQAWARSWRPGQLPNGNVFSCANCHIDPGGGGPRNPFGQAVEAELTRLYGNAVGEQRGFWSASLSGFDSDGDFYTNGEELGDPAGTWIQGTPNPPGPVTHPGNPSSHPFNAPPSISINNPPAGSVFTTPANVVIEALASDPDGTIAAVEFFDGATLLGTRTTSPYGLTTLLALTGQHSLTAVATDNRGARTTSSAVSVTVHPPGTPPTVQIISPASGAAFTNTPVALLLQATAIDNDGVVTNVEFFDDLTSLGSTSTDPFSINATLAYGGTHSLTAVARDDAGWASTSAVVVVIVQGGRLWNVDIMDHTFVPATLNITLGDTVRWTVHSSLNHTVTSATGAFPAANLTNGTGSTYDLTFTNAGIYAYLCAYHTIDTISSQRGTIIVEPSAAPVVSVIEPTNNATFTTHDIITLRASAADPNGFIRKVEFFDSGKALGAVTNEPYSLSVTLPPGSRTLTAQATDNENGTATSSPIIILVNTVPITNPIARAYPPRGSDH